MSKFDFNYMSNDDAECVAFNKQKWRKDNENDQN